MPVTRITVANLRVADIIVSTTNATISGAIRNAIGADISHAGLFTQPNFVIEAIGDGVKEHTYDEAYREATLAIALRRRNMTEDLKNSVVAHARRFAGLPYDGVGAAGSGMTTNRGALLGIGGCFISPLGCAIGQAEIYNNARDANKDTKFFCSELVARAFELAGVPISDHAATYTNPRAIRVSSYLMYVGHLIGG
jgi:uncharacterized protein YycO